MNGLMHKKNTGLIANSGLYQKRRAQHLLMRKPRKQRRRSQKKCVGYPIGYPCVVMLLSSIMWSMQFVGLVLKMMGLKWSEFRSTYFGLFATISAQWAALELYVWASYKSKKNAGTGKKASSYVGSVDCNGDG